MTGKERVFRRTQIPGAIVITGVLMSFWGTTTLSARDNDELRIWTNADGQTINAALQGYRDGEVILEKKDRTEYSYPVGKLSDADHEYIRAWQLEKYPEEVLPGPPVTGMPGYKLVWADEFEVPGRPDPNNYNYERGFVRNNEDQYYQEDNAFVENGMLVIEARKERVENARYERGSNDWRRKEKYSRYTSASLKTSGKHSWLYGRFEMRARLPIGEGMWPAYWTLGSARGWPECGEIDIMEYYKGHILANTAWGSGTRFQPVWDSSRHPVSKLGGRKFAKEFHVWRMDWDENSIKLYLNGKLLNETDVNKTFNKGTDQNPFREPHFLLVNLALGGMNGGDASKGRYPARYEIDYLRVYQKSGDAVNVGLYD